MKALTSADLPVGSVVADETRTWIKTERTGDLAAYCWQPGGWSDSQIDQHRERGAEVLRVGDGKDN